MKICGMSMFDLVFDEQISLYRFKRGNYSLF